MSEPEEDDSEEEPGEIAADYIGKVLRSMRTVTFSGEGADALDDLYRACGRG